MPPKKKEKKVKKEPKEKKEGRDEIDSLVDALPQGFRDTWERMPEAMKDYFMQAAAESSSPEEFVARIMVGGCPQCGAADTASGDMIKEIDDPTVGMCRECGFVWCLECETPLEPGSECWHWNVCRDCDHPKNEYGDCGTLPSECEPIKHWLETHPVRFHEMVCGWCGGHIDEESEHFVFGARVTRSDLLPAVKRGVTELAFKGKGKRKILALVTAEGTVAKTQGKDLLFVTCCEACAEDLSKALEDQGGAYELIL